MAIGLGGIILTSAFMTIVERILTSKVESGTDSILDFNARSRIEPIVAVDSRIRNHPGIKDVLQLAITIYCANYLLAVHRMGLNVDAEIQRQIDTLNPDRDFRGALKQFKELAESSNSLDDVRLLSKEAYAYDLPLPNKPIGVEYYGSPSFEASKEVVLEDIGLGVGKIMEIKLTNGNAKDGSETTVMTLVRANAVTIDEDVMVDILSIGARNSTFKERYYQLKSGEISFWRDLVFCEDLIRAERRVLMADKKGILKEISKRRSKNTVATAMTGRVSIGEASSVWVFSKASRMEVEANTGYKISDYRNRSRMFEETTAIMMIEIDPQYDVITIYQRGINIPMELNMSELKRADKALSGDFNKILESLLKGSLPSF